MKKVSPNRMELLRLKKRKILAEKGHRLLEDKLENLIAGFHRLIRQFKETSQEWEKRFNNFFEQYIFLKAQVYPHEFDRLLAAIETGDINLTFERLLSLNLPRISFKETKESYSPLERPPQWDRLHLERGKVLESLCKLTEIYLALEKVSQEILKTRRRVNALEYILIPYIDNAVKFIESKLSEIEREFLSQILRIKELIRK